MKHIAIFGASGASGIILLQAALQQGLTVHASCRNASAFERQLRSLSLTTDRYGSQLSITEGNLSDPQTAEEHAFSVVQGCEAVFCTIGARPPYTDIFCERATTSILKAMHRAGVGRFFCQTGAMIGTDSTHLSWFMRTMKERFAANRPALAADRLAQERVIATLAGQCGIQWTIVKPPRLTNGKRTARYKIAEMLRITAFSSVSRNDVAHCFLQFLSSTDARLFANKALFITD